jgi:hypothetical protein
MTGNNWIFFLACAFSLAFACLLFFALYSRTVEPYDEPSTLVPQCTENDKLGGSATLGGDGHIYIIKNEELVCVMARGNDPELPTPTPTRSPPTQTQSITSHPPYCEHVSTHKKRGGDGRLWGMENNRPCVKFLS